MNKTFVIGNLSADAEIKEANGKKFVVFNLGNTEKYTDSQGQKKETTTWFKCAYFQGEKLAPYLKKGTKILVEGTVKSSAWIDKEGKAKSSLELVVFKLEFLSKPPEAKPTEQKDPPLDPFMTGDFETHTDGLPF